MKLCLKILAVVIVATTMISLIGCAAPAHFSYSNVTVSVSYIQCSSNCVGVPAYLNLGTSLATTYNPQNGAMTEQAGNNCVNIITAVTNAPANITYTLYPSPALAYTTPLPSGGTTLAETPTTVGTVNYGTGNTNFYCPPGSVPIYKGAQLQQAQSFSAYDTGVNAGLFPNLANGIPQGTVLLLAGVPTNPNTPSSSCVLPTSPGCAMSANLIQLFGTGMTTGQMFLYPSTPTGYTAPINFVVSTTTTATTTFVASSTSGSAILTGIANTNTLVPLETITGTGIPAGTTITAVTPPSVVTMSSTVGNVTTITTTNVPGSVTMSANATSTNAGETVTITDAADVLTMVSPASTASITIATAAILSGPGIPLNATITGIGTGAILISAPATVNSSSTIVLDGATTQNAVTVPHNTTFQFTGFAVGAPPCFTPGTCIFNSVSYPLYTTDNKVNWLVGPSLATAVSGGSTTYGTISGTGLYTAPQTIPALQPIIFMESDYLYSAVLDAYITID
jgi:hypothetical protein